MSQRAQTREAEYQGTSRFEILGRLGEGGMGIVYRARDRERNTEVALKLLANVDATGIFRFKQEFRALADVAHRNLVPLYELFSEDSQWFFTMQLVDGVDFLTYVCGASVDRVRVQPDTSSLTVRDGGLDEGTPIVEAPEHARPKIDRLRIALPQLVTGVMALHESGHLHQDIKPANVMVTTDDRVLLMDFGVVAALGLRSAAGEEHEVAGTPAYMAPERSMSEAPTVASDWYSVGVMLYELLAGRLPYTGAPMRMLWDKAHSLPPPIRLARPEVPADLDRLCMDLLRPRPEDRPTGAEILERLGVVRDGERRKSIVAVNVADAEPALVGRDAHLATLRELFEQTRQGRGTTIYVHGVSGMGKSALVRSFLDEVKRDPTAIVLGGRCYERESVPYKAVDTVIDALCEHLLALPASEVAELMPEGAVFLATLFPVLRRIDAIAGELAPEWLHRPERLRHRAIAALRELLSNLAARRPVVVAIDDLQWGDVDSAPLLDAITSGPDAPALMLLGSYRTSEADRSALLRSLFAPRPDRPPPRKLAVEALDPNDARAVAAALFVAHGSSDSGLAGAVALESGGNPLFLHELVRYVAAERVRQIPSLDAVILARVDRLGDDMRKLVEVVGVAGLPIEQHVARTAARLDKVDWANLVQRAAAARLVRVSGRRNDDLIECYHDRIRETLTARLSADQLSRYHRELALALQESDRRDPETLAHLYAGAGEPKIAAHYALQAADLAAAALAFDRAADLYRRALELDATGLVVREVELRLAASLVNAGHGLEAARTYLAAAVQRDGAQVLELRRLAAEQLLRSGYVDEGIATLANVLDGVGLSLPRSPARSIPMLLWRRFRLRLRGLEPADRSATQVELARLEACRTTTMGLALFQPVRAAAFSTRHLHMTLDAGDPHRISFALAVEAGYHASAKNPSRANMLLQRAEAIAVELDHPLLHGCVGTIRAILSYERADFRDAFERCEHTEVFMRDHLTGMAWELHTVQMFSLHSLFFLGEFRELSRRTTQHIADARARGDLYAIMNNRSLIGSCMHLVLENDPDTASAEIADVEKQLPPSGFYLQHMFLLYAKTFVDFYLDQPERAYQRLIDNRRAVQQSLLLADRSVATFWAYLVGTSALGAALRHPAAARRLVRVGLRCARKLESDGAEPYLGMARMLYGAAACVCGQRDDARAHVEAASELFERASMKAFATGARRRLGELIGGDRGAELVAAADAELAANAVVRPENCARVLVPSFR